MPPKDPDAIEATLTSKGQITVPGEIRRELNLSAGDKIRFVRGRDGAYSIEVRKKRSILDYARANPIRVKSPIKDLDEMIDRAVGEAMIDQERRAKKNSRV